jgi:hypothetical protein
VRLEHPGRATRSAPPLASLTPPPRRTVAERAVSMCAGELPSAPRTPRTRARHVALRRASSSPGRRR